MALRYTCFQFLFACVSRQNFIHLEEKSVLILSFTLETRSKVVKNVISHILLEYIFEGSQSKCFPTQQLSVNTRSNSPLTGHLPSICFVTLGAKSKQKEMSNLRWVGPIEEGYMVQQMAIGTLWMVKKYLLRRRQEYLFLSSFPKRQCKEPRARKAVQETKYTVPRAQLEFMKWFILSSPFQSTIVALTHLETVFGLDDKLH